MNHATNRRNFLKTSLQAGLGLTALGCLSASQSIAIEAIKRPGKCRLQLSLAAYSFRQYFNHKEETKKLNLFDFVDYCAEQGLSASELTSYYFPKPPTQDFLLKLKRHAFLRGVEISGSAVGNNFAQPKSAELDKQIAMVKQWIDYSAVIGAPHIRVFAGPESKMPLEEAKKMSIACLEECCEYAGSKGIFLGLENHHGIVADPKDLLDIVHSVKSPWLGINLDTGNFNTEDPYADLAKCAPYAVNVQYKVEIKRKGSKEKEIADMDRVFKILRDANYQGYVALEYESTEDPYKAIPGWLTKLKEKVGG